MVRVGIFIVWLLHFLPLAVLAVFGNGLGLLLYLFAAERRNVADVNLSLCFPEMGEEERRRLLRRHFQAIARSIIERGILWWASGERIKKLVRIEGEEHFRAALGKPVIILSAHFAAFEVGGYWMTLHADAVDVYTKQKNPHVNAFLLKNRGRFGNQLLYSRQEGMRPVIKAVREGRPLYYLMDQDVKLRDGMFVPFFGVQAATVTSLPRLVEITGAKIVPCITRVLPGGAGYVTTFYPAWENYPSGDVAADTRRVNEFIEQRVLEMPEQYFWLHKRFKTRPKGEKKFY
ncbi:MAG: lipid A biosynthesis acyltransferase [Pseudomonadota bacterium]